MAAIFNFQVRSGSAAGAPGQPPPRGNARDDALKVVITRLSRNYRFTPAGGGHPFPTSLGSFLFFHRPRGCHSGSENRGSAAVAPFLIWRLPPPLPGGCSAPPPPSICLFSSLLNLSRQVLSSDASLPSSRAQNWIAGPLCRPRPPLLPNTLDEHCGEGGIPCSGI